MSIFWQYDPAGYGRDTEFAYGIRRTVSNSRKMPNYVPSKSHKKYKATTNSKPNLPAAENILDRDFTADRRGQKMVSDITYIPTDEGWLYLAGVMDLCGDKIVGPKTKGCKSHEGGCIPFLICALWTRSDFSNKNQQ